MRLFPSRANSWLNAYSSETDWPGFNESGKGRTEVRRTGERAFERAEKETYYLLEFPVAESLLDLVELAAEFVATLKSPRAALCPPPTTRCPAPPTPHDLMRHRQYLRISCRVYPCVISVRSHLLMISPSAPGRLRKTSRLCRMFSTHSCCSSRDFA